MASIEQATQLKVLDELIKLVARAFYPEDHVVVLDGLVKHKQYIKDDELATLLRLHHKQVRLVLNTFQNHKLVKSEIRSAPSAQDLGIEDAPNSLRRQQNFVFWYIDYRHFVDVVKLRLLKISDSLAADTKPQYFCPKCQAKYSEKDVDKVLNPLSGMLECTRCKIGLQDSGGGRRSHSQQAEFNKQVKPITDRLKLCESFELPYFNRDSMNEFFRVHAVKTAEKAEKFISGTSGGATPRAGRPAKGGDEARRNWDTPQLIVDLPDIDEQAITAIGEFPRSARKSDSSAPGAKRKPPVPWLTSSSYNPNAPSATSSTSASAALSSSRAAASASSSSSQPAPVVDLEPAAMASDWNRRFWSELKAQLDRMEAESAAAVKQEPRGEYGAPPAPSVVTRLPDNVEAADGTSVHWEDASMDVDEPVVRVGSENVRLSCVTEEHRERMSAAQYQAYYETWLLYLRQQRCVVATYAETESAADVVPDGVVKIKQDPG